MSISKDSLSSIPTCYATVSVGTPNHNLEEKLKAIAGAGFQGIELGFPDLLSFASKNLGRDVGPQEFDILCNSGLEVKRICTELGLKIVMLQPFSNFEGWKPQSAERKDAYKRAKGWIKIMEALGTDMLQVGSTDSPIPTARDVAVSDLKELADLLAPHNFRLAYENWCWSTHAPDWKDVWEIVKKVDRPNVGLCLDTFQTAGGEWADPTTQSGLLEGEESREAIEKKFQESLQSLAATIPPEKIYILQISDAYRPKTPLDSDPDENGLRPRGRWSSCLRPVPFDGGYLPVVDVAKAILKTGFRGWFSMEVFDGGPDGQDQEWKDMPGYTKKAMNAHERLLREVADA
ncbi:hypothetical protein JMJ35_002459 [Cladonia borealis]|uniref:Xylose isomerase-like TIM barrel domain-containing protein n=1 Tax=Cladonia borealis TaxID=184061 RepID=A0AA39R597_9LECA|nr:hypothetical protein JMJ35_002459 [Cladonia borealis]